MHPNPLLTGTWKAKKFISKWYHMSQQKDLTKHHDYTYIFKENGEFTLIVAHSKKKLNYCGNYSLDSKGLYLDYQGEGYEQHLYKGDQSDVTYGVKFENGNPILICYYEYGLLYKIELEKVDV